MTSVFGGKLWSDLWLLKPFNLVDNGSHCSFCWFVSRWHFHNHWKWGQAVSISRLVRSRDAPTHAHKESFLSDLTQTLFIPSFLFSIFLPAACLHISPLIYPLTPWSRFQKHILCSSTHSSSCPLPRLLSYVCDWQKGSYSLGKNTQLPSQMGGRSERGPAPPGFARVTVHQQCDSVQPCELRLEQVPAVLPQGV